MSKHKIRTFERRLKERREAREDDSEVWVIEIIHPETGEVADRLFSYPTTRLGMERKAAYLAALAQNDAAELSAGEVNHEFDGKAASGD